MFHRIIFLLLIVSGLSCNFNRCFQSFMNIIACRSTQNAARIKSFLRLCIVIQPLNNQKNKHNKFFITLKRNSVNVHSNNWPQLALQIWRLPKVITSWPYRWFWKFWNGFAKSPRLIVLNIDWVQFVLKNCEILHSVRGLYDKYSAS